MGFSSFIKLYILFSETVDTLCYSRLSQISMFVCIFKLYEICNICLYQDESLIKYYLFIYKQHTHSVGTRIHN